MKINEKHLKELRSCELYQHLLPRYKKSIEWIIKTYIELSEKENIPTKVYFVTKQKNDSIKIHSPLEVEINQRRLIDLNELDFDFGLQFTSDCFMPFFGEGEIALFSLPGPMSIEDVENGMICLIKCDVLSQYFLVTKEASGFFGLDCEYFCGLDEKGIRLEGILANIETR